MWLIASLRIDGVFDKFHGNHRYHDKKTVSQEIVNHRSLSKNFPVVFIFAQKVRAKIHSIVVIASIVLCKNR